MGKGLGLTFPKEEIQMANTSREDAFFLFLCYWGLNSGPTT
jgi:hypothetical protein